MVLINIVEIWIIFYCFCLNSLLNAELIWTPSASEITIANKSYIYVTYFSIWSDSVFLLFISWFLIYEQYCQITQLLYILNIGIYFIQIILKFNSFEWTMIYKNASQRLKHSFLIRGHKLCFFIKMSKVYQKSKSKKK